ncbi:MAG: PHP domain-containing protein [Coriobacteriales bacterium]
MRLKADLHTHTLASSHAYSTATEIAMAASARGLELVALTDHGPAVPGGAHLWHFWNLKVVPSILSGVRLLKGCEADPVPDTPNGIDLPDGILEQLDFVAVGLHPECGFDDHDRSRNTEAMLRVMENPLVDMVSHPGNEDDFPLEIDTVVAAAVEHDVILELNNYSFDPRSGRHASLAREREFAAAARDAGAKIAINSDAHFHLLVGDVSHAASVASEIEFPLERIVNRDAEAALEFLLGKRERPGLDAGGEW